MAGRRGLKLEVPGDNFTLTWHVTEGILYWEQAVRRSCRCIILSNTRLNFGHKEKGMSNVAQVDKIVSEINGLGETDRVLLFRRMDEMFASSGIRQDNDVSVESAFGLWRDRDITKESLRERAWMKK